MPLLSLGVLIATRMSNEKASVTKEQSEKHMKVLKGLMKLPENKECADCKSKGPRWASINLGVFICIQCSGIHRSLGVHISKVRSVTLDTWLPEQVAFIQGMGNGRANMYWEAELAPTFKRPIESDREGLEAFIRAKYEARTWIPIDKKSSLGSYEGIHSSNDARRRSFDDSKGSSMSGCDQELKHGDAFSSGTPIRYKGQQYEASSVKGLPGSNEHIELKATQVAEVKLSGPF